MAHNCKRVQPGHQVCPEHMLTKNGLRYRFKKQMQDTIPFEELQEWKDLMEATMLESDDKLKLDDRPHSVIELIARGGVAS